MLFRSNCTTRIKDGLFKNTPFQPSSLPVTSYRASIVSAPYNHQLPWIGLGIDLLLGAYSDQKPSDFQAGFLPFLFHQQVANTKGLVVKENVYKFSDASPASNNTPLSTLLVILILYAFCSRFNSLITQKIAKIFDVLLLVSLGVGGSLMFYMSFISKHTACYQNYNLIFEEVKKEFKIYNNIYTNFYEFDDLKIPQLNCFLIDRRKVAYISKYLLYILKENLEKLEFNEDNLKNLKISSVYEILQCIKLENINSLNRTGVQSIRLEYTKEDDREKLYQLNISFSCIYDESIFCHKLDSSIKDLYFENATKEIKGAIKI